MNKTECSNCKYFVEITGHPWNEPGTFTHGRIVDRKCFGCTVVVEECGQVVMFDKSNGLCEMHEYKKVKE